LDNLNYLLDYQDKLADMLNNKKIYEFYNNNTILSSIITILFITMLIIIIRYIYYAYCKKPNNVNQIQQNLELRNKNVPLTIREVIVDHPPSPITENHRIYYDTRSRRRNLGLE